MMNTHPRYCSVPMFVLATAFALAAGGSAFAQTSVGTAFTYQGILSKDGSPLNDSADFEFTLWDDPSSTDPNHLVAGPVPVDNVEVENGLILMPIDLDVAPWTSDTAYWLEIQVRSPSGMGDFVTLQPRQRVTPTPVSLSTRGINVDEEGNVGIGTPDPVAKLDVMGTALVGGFRMPPGAVAGYVLTAANDLGVGHWQPPGEFTLPFEGETPSEGPVMKITNTGEGVAIVGEHGQTGNSGRLGGPNVGAFGSNAIGSFGYLGGVQAAVYGEAPDGGHGALGVVADGRFGGMGGSYGVEGSAPLGGGRFWDTDDSGYTYIAAGDCGIDARGSNMAGVFMETDQIFTYTTIAGGGNGISAFGDVMGGYFADDPSTPTGYAEVAAPGYGIKAYGNTRAGRFENTASSSYVYLAGMNRGVYGAGPTAGGYFRDIDGTGSAEIAYGDRGIEGYGSEMGGYFADSSGSPTGYAHLGLPYCGIEAYGSDVGGRFEDTDGASEARVAYGGIGVYASAVTLGGWFEDDEGSYAKLAWGLDPLYRGIEAYGSEYGGHFTSDTCGSYAEVLPVGAGTYIGAYGGADGGSGTNYGVSGHAAGTGTNYGAYGEAVGQEGINYGVYGYAEGGAVDYGVYGRAVGTAPNDYAGYFDGDVHVTGDLSASGTKPFKIDHPLDPESEYLYHYALESPEVLNVYRGTAVLDAGGRAWAQLPDYFAEINRDFHYQLTCVGGFAPMYVAKEIEGNRFQIAGGSEGLKVCWMVTAVRDDAYVRQHGAPVEQEKPENQRGKYLHPELYGQPETTTIGYDERASSASR